MGGGGGCHHGLAVYVLPACLKMLTILAKDGSGEEVLQNLAVLLKRTFHFLPGHKLVHLLGQLPEFLPNKTSNVNSHPQFSAFSKYPQHKSQ